MCPWDRKQPASLVFRGTLWGLSIEGRGINKRLTLQVIMPLPPNPHGTLRGVVYWGKGYK